MKLNDKQKLLMSLYSRIATVFDEITDELCSKDYSGPEKAAMQAQIFCAVVNDFVSTLPDITPAYIKQLVDYVFACRAQFYGALEKGTELDELPVVSPPTPKTFN